MDKFDRSTRRHHRRRVFVKRVRQFYFDRYDRKLIEARTRGTYAHWNIVRHVDTPAACRNACCANARKRYGNGAAGIHPKQWQALHFAKCDARFE